MPKSIDLTKQSDQGLKNYFANCQRLNQVEAAKEALVELTKRGLARNHDYAALEWNQQKVKEFLKPFVDISSLVPGNQRTKYTEAGGARIGHSKDSPEWCWIDTYTAIKTDLMNAVFVCYVARPGDDPYFQLHIDGTGKESYSASEKEKALSDWGGIANAAVDGK